MSKRDSRNAELEAMGKEMRSLRKRMKRFQQEKTDEVKRPQIAIVPEGHDPTDDKENGEYICEQVSWR